MSNPRLPLRVVITATLLASAAAPAQDSLVTRLSSPIVIAHRGASGERPEHTLAAYELAIDEGADVIEPDLVPTKDGVLVARHENEIGGTTDVAAHPEFAARRTTKTIDGEAVTGWFTEDFTLAELKTLRARERLPQLRPANVVFDGRFEIPTLAEVIALAKRRHVGIYPETKHPTYFASIGLPTDAPLVRQLHAAGWTTPDAPVFIQSFEVANLKHLKTLTKLRLIQLVDATGGPADKAVASYAAMTSAAGLRQVATYAWGIGPAKAQVTATLVGDAHAAGLRVHPWTFRAENQFLPPPYRRGDDLAAHGDVAGEIHAALKLGIDGFFTDFPLIGVQTRDRAVPRRE
ncbi:glycerophosphodiester phosphodiesterase [Sphingomonas sp. KR1UV-12]|uniref:glycerophosphodiester phosphodiesterase n=1 Tax=Sphingomonas aurea TaxID=3063994 RepID=A0ABT9EPF4_9SPHN|nr:glycerophosphodiester phosphodiesterase [Sphingomonas sp. KR1UV-12]MDP1028523.1 glycerophosphodiester phosphodiesterase [Sphingomonas sp. KR1UV-12]